MNWKRVWKNWGNIILKARGNNKGRVFLIGFMLLIIGFFIVLQNTSKSKQNTEIESLEQNNDQTKVEDKAASMENISEPEKKSDILESSKEPTQNPDIEILKSKTESSTNAPSRPIATNFEPNPLLEEEMKDLLRGGSIEIELELPEENAQFNLSNDKVDFHFKGTIKTSEELDDNSIKLYLFSNRVVDFQNWNPVLETPLELKNDREAYYFSKILSPKLTPGLYYYLFEDTQEESYLKIGKVYIREE